MMKLMARTNEVSYLNNGKGEGWAEVTECRKVTPSGVHKAVRFPNGFIVKEKLCELVYVFDK